MTLRALGLFSKRAWWSLRAVTKGGAVLNKKKIDFPKDL